MKMHIKWLHVDGTAAAQMLSWDKSLQELLKELSYMPVPAGIPVNCEIQIEITGSVSKEELMVLGEKLDIRSSNERE